MIYRVPTDGAVLMRATQTLAYLNAAWKPTRVPAVFRDALPADLNVADTDSSTR
jgi:acyl-CoA thioesterase FadM